MPRKDLDPDIKKLDRDTTIIELKTARNQTDKITKMQRLNTSRIGQLQQHLSNLAIAEDPDAHPLTAPVVDKASGKKETAKAT